MTLTQGQTQTQTQTIPNEGEIEKDNDIDVDVNINMDQEGEENRQQQESTLLQEDSAASSATFPIAERSPSSLLFMDEDNRLPTSDKGCKWNYRERKCGPSPYCKYQYRFLDATLSESCRLKPQFQPRQEMSPVFSSTKIQTNPILLGLFATGLFALDIGAIVLTPLLQRFPLSFNIVQGFILCFSGDTLFQIIEQRRKPNNAYISEENSDVKEHITEDTKDETKEKAIINHFPNTNKGGNLLQKLKNKVTKPFQNLKNIWKEQIGFKVFRAFRAGMIGALNNGFIHYNYYKWIDKRFPYHLFADAGPKEGLKFRLAVAWAKYWIEWPTIGAYKILSMMGLTTLFSKGGNWEKFMDKVKASFKLSWLRSLQVWPIYDTILYAYVPVTHRPLFNTFMSILWGGYLSSVSQVEPEDTLNSANSEAKDVTNPYFTGKFTIVEDNEDVEDTTTRIEDETGDDEGIEMEEETLKDDNLDDDIDNDEAATHTGEQGNNQTDEL